MYLSSRNAPAKVFKPESMHGKQKTPWLNAIVFFLETSSSIWTCQYLLFAFSVENTVVSPSQSTYLFMYSLDYKSRILPAINLPQSTQKGAVASSFWTNTMGDVHSVRAGSIRTMEHSIYLLPFKFSRPWPCSISG